MTIINKYIYNAYMSTYIANSKMDKYDTIIKKKKDTIKISKSAKTAFKNLKAAFLPKYSDNYLYFENRSCCFFPCHSNIDKGMNCMFCRCPLYKRKFCSGIVNGLATILENGTKDCTNCNWNHRYENADFLSKYHGE